LAAVVMVMVAGGIKDVPLVGLVMATVGGELVATVTVTGSVVVLAPRLSEALALSACEPTPKLTERLKGLEDTLPSEVFPSKNWKLGKQPCGETGETLSVA